MNRTRVISAALLAALAATAACPRATAAQNPTTAPAPPATPAERSAQELKLLADALNGANRRLSRDDAARRLLQRGGADGLRILRDAVEGPNRESKLAVARALQDNPDPPGVFLKPLLDGLTDKLFVDAAAGALSSYRRNAAAIDGLIAFSRDAEQLTSSRIAVARALGEVPEKRSAEALGLLLDAKEQPALRNAAADALRTITGRRDFGRDSKKWTAWLAANANKPAVQWKADLLPDRAADHAQSERQRLALVNRLRTMLDAQYRATPKEQRGAFMLEALNAPEPEARMLAARDLVGVAFQEGILVNGASADAVRDRLADLVGDAAADVRLEAAKALFTINYANALDPLLNQLAVEKDDGVRVQQIKTLGRIQNIRSVPQLRTLLKDQSPVVGRAAADALKQLGPTIRDKDPNLARQVAEDLISIIRNTNRDELGGQELRESSIGALAPLRHPETFELARHLLVDTESVGVRRQMLLALGELGDPNTADLIVDWLAVERERGLRLEALEALGKTGGLDQSPVFIMLMNPNREAEKEVRDRAREIFKSLLPSARAAQLQSLLGAFKSDADIHSAILIAWIKRLDAAGQVSDVALQEINLADDLMKLSRPADAVPHYRRSLDLLLKLGQEGGREGVISKLLDALLVSKQYEQAAVFGQEMIQQLGRQQQTTVGAKLKNEADRLNTANRLDDAQTLIKAALKMDPPLDEKYQSDLRQFDAEVQQKRAEKSR